MEFAFLKDLIVIFAAAILVVGLLRRLGVPSIAGFILAGMLIGPQSLGWISDIGHVQLLAEVGVALLLFGIGLDLPIDHLKDFWKPILFGGSLQVGLTTLLTIVLAQTFGLSLRPAIFLGFLFAVSSTAIVLRGLQSRNEINAPHGRLALGFLLFQDICVIPMMLALPLLASTEPVTIGSLLPIFTASGAMLLLFLAAHLVVPRALKFAAMTRQRELFVLAMVLACLGTAWVAHLFGISLALGAFMAGLVLSGSEYRHQALSDLIPFREVLTSLFFVSIGMLLSPAIIVRDFQVVFLLLLAILLGKFAIVLLAGRMMRLPSRVSVLTAASLSQVGEFSFVLLLAAQGTLLLDSRLAGNFSMAAILSMLVTPLILAAGPHLAAGVVRVRPLTRLLQVRTVVESEKEIESLRGHIVIAGYGVTGQELVTSLIKSQIPYVVVEMNPKNVRAAGRLGHSAVYGDATSPEILEMLGIEKALALVVVINDPDAAARSVSTARRLAPNLKIIARTRFVADNPGMVQAGVSEVVAAEIEAAVEVTHRILACCNIDKAAIDNNIARIRSRRTEEIES